MRKNRRLANRIGKVPKIRQTHKSVKRRKPKSISTLHKKEDAEFKIVRRKIERGTTKVLTGIANIAFAPKNKVNNYKPSTIKKTTSFKAYRDSFKPPASAKTTKKVENFYEKLYEQYTRKFQKDSISGRKWYGSYPAPLGKRKIIEVTLSKRGRDFLMLQVDTRDRDIYVMAISEALRKLHKKILTYGKTQIKRFVPMDTGELRKSLIKSLYISKQSGSIVPKEGNTMIDNLELKMRFFTELKYAGIVNKMPNQILQHPSKIHPGINFGRTGNLLDDPYALKGFFSMVVVNIKNMINNHYKTEFYNDIKIIINNWLEKNINILTTERKVLKEYIKRSGLTFQQSIEAKKFQVQVETERKRMEEIKSSPLKYVNRLFKITM